jgi:outer membrane protein TolC
LLPSGSIGGCEDSQTMTLRNVLLAVLLASGAAAAADDPFLTLSRELPSPAAEMRPAAVCSREFDRAAPLTLAAAVERALCANPDTRSAWITARLRAAERGQAEAAFLPGASLDAGFGRRGARALPDDDWAWNIGVRVQFLLYDFGGRRADRDAAEALLAAAHASHDASVRRVYLETVAAWFAVLSAEGSVAAARQTEAAALETVKAARARVAAGSAIPADRLQAETVHAQRQIERIRAEGERARLRGELAALMGDAGHGDYRLAANETAFADMPAVLERLDALIAAAKLRRPELRAAEATLAAREANVASVTAAGKPTLSAIFESRRQDTGPTAGTASSLNLAVSVPLFTGYRSTYQIRAAEAQRELAAVDRDRVANQVALDVWQAYHKFKSEGEVAARTDALVAGAEAAESVALGRYKAGVGNILDVLTAQANLATARQTRLQSQLGLRVARAELAQAMGDLTWDWIERPATPVGKGAQ